MKKLIAALLVFTLSGIAEASFTFVQSNANESGATIGLTGVGAGNLIVLCTKWEGAAGTITATDGTTALTVNPLSLSGASGATDSQCAYLLSANSGNKTYTITFPGGASFQRNRIAEFSYTGGVAVFDTGEGDEGTGTAVNTGNFTTTGNDELVFGMYGENNSAPLTSPLINGAAADGTVGDSASNLAVMWYKAFGTTFTGAASGTISPSAVWAASAVAFKIAGSNEQEGFRFRNDDGSETTATWAEAQDTDVTAPLSTNLRLRMLVNTTDDAGAATYQLESKKSSESDYVRVSTCQPIAGDVAYGALGTRSNSAGATSRSPALPATHGSLIWAVVSSKNNATHSSSSPGWVKWDQQNSAATWTTSLWYYIVDGSEAAPTISWTGSAVCFGQTFSLTGTHLTSPIGASRTNAATSATHSCNGITTTKPGSRVIYIDSSAANTAIAQPAGFTENHDNGSATGGTRNAAGGQNISASGQTSSNISVTGASATWNMWQIEMIAAARPILVSLSGNVTAGGEATTVQLTAPSGKSTSDFDAGRMWDDENGTDAVTVSADDYTEAEWSLIADSVYATNGDIYQFRVTSAGTPFTTYSVTPQWTIGAGGGGGGTDTYDGSGIIIFE